MVAPFEFFFKKALILAFDANGATTGNCTFLPILEPWTDFHIWEPRVDVVSTQRNRM